MGGFSWSSVPGGFDFDGESAIIESFISNLRKKVDNVEPKLIHTVRGVGYSLREP